MITEDAIPRFLAYLDVREDDDCWPWTSAEIGGYGVLRVLGKNVKAAHIAIWLTTGQEANGRQALHSCDNPPCCNPRHLRFGTVQENADDRLARGRQFRFDSAAKARVSARFAGVPKSAEHRAKIAAGNSRRPALYQRVVRKFAFGD